VLLVGLVYRSAIVFVVNRDASASSFQRNAKLIRQRYMTITTAPDVMVTTRGLNYEAAVTGKLAVNTGVTVPHHAKRVLLEILFESRISKFETELARTDIQLMEILKDN